MYMLVLSQTIVKKYLYTMYYVEINVSQSHRCRGRSPRSSE